VRWTWLALLLAVVTAREAIADDDDADADWGAPAPSVIVTQVHGRLDGTSARLDARLEFDATEVGMSATAIDLPPHAVVTAANATADGITHRLALLPAADASAALHNLLEGSGGQNRSSGIVLRLDDHVLYAETIVPRLTHFELELRLEATTCYYRDERYVAIPADWQGAIDSQLARTSIAAANELKAECHAPDGSAWIAFPSRELANLPAGDARIGASGERLSIGSGDLASAELSIAHTLGEVPRDLHTALVVDASRSLSKEQADAQLAIVDSYLSAAPHGEVQVIAYARHASALLPMWTVAERADTRIDHTLSTLARSNGSNLDVGLAEAAAWLARVGGTRRVILFTDERVASRLDSGDTSELARLLPPGTLVHVVALSDGAGAITRDDDATFAPLAAATLGMSVRGRVQDSGAADATLLARPISLDHVEVKDEGWHSLSVDDVTTCNGIEVLPEGSSCTWWGSGASDSAPITIEGMVWGSRVVRVVNPDRTRARSLARTLSTMTGLDAAVAQEVERAAVAVNSMWSLFASWGGPDGYGGWSSGCDTGCGLGTVGFGSAHCGGYFTSGSRPQLDLHDQLAHAIRACHADHLRVQLEVETTLEEIVGVDVGVAGPGTQSVHDCLVEATWNTMLAIPDPPPHATTTVYFN
jgi:hypothetical protein